MLPVAVIVRNAASIKVVQTPACTIRERAPCLRSGRRSTRPSGIVGFVVGIGEATVLRSVAAGARTINPARVHLTGPGKALAAEPKKMKKSPAQNEWRGLSLWAVLQQDSVNRCPTRALFNSAHLEEFVLANPGGRAGHRGQTGVISRPGCICR